LSEHRVRSDIQMAERGVFLMLLDDLLRGPCRSWNNRTRVALPTRSSESGRSRTDRPPFGRPSVRRPLTSHWRRMSLHLSIRCLCSLAPRSTSSPACRPLSSREMHRRGACVDGQTEGCSSSSSNVAPHLMLWPTWQICGTVHKHTSRQVEQVLRRSLQEHPYRRCAILTEC
jgi:hypothetical protein